MVSFLLRLIYLKHTESSPFVDNNTVILFLLLFIYVGTVEVYQCVKILVCGSFTSQSFKAVWMHLKVVAVSREKS